MEQENRTQSNETPSTPGTPKPKGKQGGISLRRAFLAGLAALLPTALSIVILVWIGKFINKHVARPINEFVIWVMGLAGIDHAKDVFYNNKVEGVVYGWFNLSFTGFVIAFAIIFIVGALLLTFFGRRLYRAVDRFLSQLPVLKMIYPHIKQLTEMVLSEKKVAAFRRVVMIEYPRKGLWSLGFVTGEPMRDLRENINREVVSIFIPSSPTPFTGYVVAAPKEDLIDIPITVDETLRFTVSGGVLVPPGQRKVGEAGRGPLPPSPSAAED